MRTSTLNSIRSAGARVCAIWWWNVTGAVVLFVWLAAVSVAGAVEGEFNLVVELRFGSAPANSADRLVEGFTATQGTSGFPGALFEDKEILKSLVRKLNPPKLKLPLAFGELISAIQALDNEEGREWLAVSNFSPTIDSPLVLISYRRGRTPFVIDLHVQGEDAASAPATAVVQMSPEVIVRYRPTSGSTSPAFTVAAVNAGSAAFKIASDSGMVVGGAGGDKSAIQKGLQEYFLLPVPGTAPDYRGSVSGGQANGIVVNPVFVPKTISVELDGWKTYEATQSAAVAVKLKAKRVAHEAEIRSKLSSIVPGEFSLVTTADVSRWQATELGKDHALTPLRYEKETLVLSAADFASEQTYVFDIGTSYDATDGLQGVGSASVLHDRRTHLELSVEGSIGLRAESETLNVKWAPRENVVGGWSLMATATADSRRNDEAHFGATVGGDGIEWRHALADLGFTARRTVGEPEVGRWESVLSTGLHLKHSDDRFDPNTVPADAELPDSFVELAAEWHLATLRGEAKHALTLDTRARVAQSTTEWGGNYDYDLGEAMLTANLVIGASEHCAWQFTASSRAGELRGAAPLSRQFRAGGNDGWIRGLREGELIGRRYWAQSIAAGPDVSSLIGGGTDGKGQVFLLAFYDLGQVLTDLKTWRTAEGYGIAVHLDKISVGDATASLLLGYAFSPDSQVDRHGSFFVRLDLPFVH